MPDKRYSKGCGKKCIRCWENRLNHGNKLKKKKYPKLFEEPTSIPLDIKMSDDRLCKEIK